MNRTKLTRFGGFTVTVEDREAVIFLKIAAALGIRRDYNIEVLNEKEV